MEIKSEFRGNEKAKMKEGRKEGSKDEGKRVTYEDMKKKRYSDE